jgi:hypothetical protein
MATPEAARVFPTAQTSLVDVPETARNVLIVSGLMLVTSFHEHAALAGPGSANSATAASAKRGERRIRFPIHDMSETGLA